MNWICNALARLLTAGVHVNEEESKYVTYLCSFAGCFVYSMCLGKILASIKKIRSVEVQKSYQINN